MIRTFANDNISDDIKSMIDNSTSYVKRNDIGNDNELENNKNKK